jgi:dUTP pyrophosphatase
MSNKTVLFTKIGDISMLPHLGTAGSAGFGLFSVTNKVMEPNGLALIETGIRIKLPAGTYGRIAPRSGLAIKELIGVGGNFLFLKNILENWLIHFMY